MKAQVLEAQLASEQDEAASKVTVRFQVVLLPTFFAAADKLASEAKKDAAPVSSIACMLMNMLVPCKCALVYAASSSCTAAGV